MQACPTWFMMVAKCNHFASPERSFVVSGKHQSLSDILIREVLNWMICLGSVGSCNNVKIFSKSFTLVWPVLGGEISRVYPALKSFVMNARHPTLVIEIFEISQVKTSCCSYLKHVQHKFMIIEQQIMNKNGGKPPRARSTRVIARTLFTTYANQRFLLQLLMLKNVLIRNQPQILTLWTETCVRLSCLRFET